MSGGLFIDGKWRPGEGPELVSTDPATEEAVWRARPRRRLTLAAL